jgi:ribosomal protein L37AE/L43A
MKRCPNCGNNKFIVTAHVVQEWIVDEAGYFIECESECLDVIHSPDDEDIWQCSKCGYENTGVVFETHINNVGNQS